MKGKRGWKEVNASSNESMTRFHTRTGWEPTSSDMPFARSLDVPLSGVGFVELVSGADDGQDGQADEWDIRQRMVGVRQFMAWLLKRGVTPMDMFRQLAAVGRGLHMAPFNAMTMEEISMMEGQSKAAHSWRCKVMSGEIELAGMNGSRLPGQKSKDATPSYEKAQKGNCNRLGGAKRTARKERQQSFLRKLKVQPKPKI